MRNKTKKACEPRAIVQYFEWINPIKDICGQIYTLSSAKDFSGANASLVVMKAPSIPHYHCEATEFYYFLAGSGFLIVRNKEIYAISANMLALIPPYNAHFIIPASNVELLVFSVPAWRKEDQIVCSEKDKNNIEVGYSPFSEKSRLIESFLAREGLDFRKRMGRKQREELDIERQALVLRMGLNSQTIFELRKFLALS